jgi:hypothetical protein
MVESGKRPLPARLIRETAWDLSFLALSIVLEVGGWLLVRTGGRNLADPS